MSEIQWRPGDEANGYRLGEDGVWRLVPPAPVVRTPIKGWQWALMGAPVVLLIGLVAVAVAVVDSRTDGMSCEDLRQDNLSMTQYMTRDYDVNRVRENNERVQALDCDWAKDGHSGPAD